MQQQATANASLVSLRRTGRSLLLTIPREGRHPGLAWSGLLLPRRIRRRLAFHSCLPFTSAAALIASRVGVAPSIVCLLRAPPPAYSSGTHGPRRDPLQAFPHVLYMAASPYRTLSFLSLRLPLPLAVVNFHPSLLAQPATSDEPKPCSAS